MQELDFYFFLQPENFPAIKSYVLKGFLFSIMLTVIATLGGMLLGTFVALLRFSKNSLLSWAAAIYVNTFRSIPLMMVLLWFFLISGIDNSEYCAVITFVAFEAAYFSEIVRAGIKSVSTEQTFAGQALGMTYGQNMRFIVLPQAYRNMIPVFLTQVIILFQDTSLVYIIGANDLLNGFRTLGSTHGLVVETYIIAAAVYFIICYSLSKAVRAYQKRVAIIR